jgi:hypothetical protein
VQNCARDPAAQGFELKHVITRPSKHLQHYLEMLEAMNHEMSVAEGHPDRAWFTESIRLIRNIKIMSDLRASQNFKGNGAAAELQWYDLVSEEDRGDISEQEAKRQS